VRYYWYIHIIHVHYTSIIHAIIGKWQMCAYISRVFARMEILDLVWSLFLSLLVSLALPCCSTACSVHAAIPYSVEVYLCKLQLWHTALHASHHLKDTFRPSTDPKEPWQLPLDKTIWNLSSQIMSFCFIPICFYASNALDSCHQRDSLPWRAAIAFVRQVRRQSLCRPQLVKKFSFT